MKVTSALSRAGNRALDARWDSYTTCPVRKGFINPFNLSTCPHPGFQKFQNWSRLEHVWLLPSPIPTWVDRTHLQNTTRVYLSSSKKLCELLNSWPDCRYSMPWHPQCPSIELTSYTCSGIHSGRVEPASSRHGDVSWVSSTPRYPFSASLHLLALLLKPSVSGLWAKDRPLSTLSLLVLIQVTRRGRKG